MSRNNVEMFLGAQINVMKFTGLWAPDNNNIVYFIYTCFTIGIHYTVQIFFWVYLGTVWGDLGAVTDGLNVMMAQLSTCLKITIIVVNRNVVRKLLDFMNSDVFFSQVPEHRRVMSEQARKMRRIYIFFMVVFNSGNIFWFLIPFFSQPRVFPYFMWMPVDPESSPGFEIGFLFQLYFGFSGTCIFPTVDVFITTLIIFGGVQLDIIKDKLMKIKNIPPLSDDVTGVDRQRLMTEHYKLLLECINQHQAVKRFIKSVENLFNTVIFIQMSSTTAIVCIIAFRLSVEPINTLRFFSSLVYMLDMLSQLYFFCWSGNELTKRCEELRDVLYQCPWYDQDRSFKKTLLIAIESSLKRPIVITSGHYIMLTRPTFVSILRSSYSLFAVLNRVNDNK